jgi:hypothetical protein
VSEVREGVVDYEFVGCVRCVPGGVGEAEGGGMSLARIDEFILDSAQVVADYIHGLIGIDAIGQRRIWDGICAAGWLLAVVSDLIHRKGFDWMAALLMLSNISTAFWGSSEESEQKRASRGGLRNPLRNSGFHKGHRFFIASAAVFLPVIVGRNGVAEYLLPCVWSDRVWAALDVLPERPARAMARVLQPVPESR